MTAGSARIRDLLDSWYPYTSRGANLQPATRDFFRRLSTLDSRLVTSACLSRLVFTLWVWYKNRPLEDSVMYAIINDRGRQLKVEKGATFQFDRKPGKTGTIEVTEVLVL